MDVAGEADAFLASLEAQASGIKAQDQQDQHTTPAAQPDGGTQRKRRNRWGAPAANNEAAPEPQVTASSGNATAGEEPPKRKKKSRWEEPEPSTALTLANIPREITLPGGIKVSLPSALIGGAGSQNPKVKELMNDLNEVNRKILNNELGIPPEHERSPSPEPVYDRNGIRLNTREIRAKDSLMLKRSSLIEELIKTDPTYRPPADYRPAKKFRKVFIPQRDYPSYNFIGLIIGPRGNTQKRMQKETNTKIAIRGKGSVKEGAARDPKYDYGEDEELHVLISGDTQDDVDKAAEMIQDLLVPTDEARNEHKRLQLRELAALNGTLKDDQHCYLCGQSGHRQFECPTQSEDTFKLPLALKEQVDALYQRDIARMGGSNEGSTDEDYKKFMAEIGMGDPAGAAGSSGQRFGGRGRSDGPAHHGLGFDGGRFSRRPGDDLPDDCKLYVGNLSHSVTDPLLKQVFEPFGVVTHATVLLDVTSGQSRGYGFVHMDSATNAGNAARGMNGKAVDGRPIIVRLRSEGPGKSFDRPRFSQPEDENAKLYISFMPPHVDDEAMHKMFSQFGEVTAWRVIIDRDTGKSKGYGFITMASAAAAAAAISGLDGYMTPGATKPMSVKIADRHGTGRGGPMGRGPAGPYGAWPAPMGGPPPGGAPWGAPQQQPPGYGPPQPGYPPPAGYNPYAAPPPGYGAPPQGAYGMAPPPYAPPAYGSTPPPGYAPPGGYAAPPAPAYPAAAPYGLPPQAYQAELQQQPPPAPSEEQPPLPSEVPPPPKDDRVQNEYERFMAEMQTSLP